jgi:hypothetical protein
MLNPSDTALPVTLAGPLTGASKPAFASHFDIIAAVLLLLLRF